MNERGIVAGGPLAAFLLAAVASVLTAGPTVLGVTPLGVAIYAGVGVAAPQYVLARRSGSNVRTVVALLAAAVAVAAVLAGLAGSGVGVQWSIGVTELLAVAVLGVAIGTTARQIHEGYRSGSQ